MAIEKDWNALYDEGGDLRAEIIRNQKISREIPEYLDGEEYQKWKIHFIRRVKSIIETYFPRVIESGYISYEGDVLVLHRWFSLDIYGSILDRTMLGLSSRSYFDQPVKLMPDVVCENLFRFCRQFNSDVIFPERFNENRQCLDYMFDNCDKFDKPLNIPEGVTSACGMLNDCRLFNSEVKLPSTLIDMQQMFDGCVRYNKPITIPKSVMHGYRAFGSCMMLNSPVTIEDGCEGRFAEMFTGCENMDSEVTIPDTVKQVYGMFKKCSRYNKKTNLPKACDTFDNMFEDCYLFNQPVEIPDGADSIHCMLSGCHSFNSPLSIPDSVVDASHLLHGCKSFNQKINIPKSLELNSYMLAGCENLDNIQEYFEKINSQSFTGEDAPSHYLGGNYYDAEEDDDYE